MKHQATPNLDDRPTPPDPDYLGTPRLTRLKNLFTGAAGPPSLLEVARKLNNLVEYSVKLPKKGAEKISIGSETATDVKTLLVRLLGLTEFNNNIPTIRRNFFAPEEDDHQFERALAGANAFGCQVPDIIKARLDQLSKNLKRIKQAATAPSSKFNFQVAKTNSSTPSYALAASKHAPRDVSAPRQAIFKLVSVRKAPSPPPPTIKPTDTLTLAQSANDGKELAGLNYPTIITTINSKLAEAGIKELLSKKTNQ